MATSSDGGAGGSCGRRSWRHCGERATRAARDSGAGSRRAAGVNGETAAGVQEQSDQHWMTVTDKGFIFIVHLSIHLICFIFIFFILMLK